MLSYKKMLEQIKLDDIKNDDLIVCKIDIDNLKTRNHIGQLKKNKLGNFGISFINRFSDVLHDLNGTLKNNNGWYINNIDDIKKYNSNEGVNSTPLTYSKRFKEIISYSLKFLLDYENIYFCDLSYVDVSDKSDTISCLLNKDIFKLEPDEDRWNNDKRTNIKIGRFLKKILPEENDQILEDYANDYKFSFKLDKEDFGRFKIAKGVNLSKWYLEKNYAPTQGGTLAASCMRHMKSQKRLSIYIMNPEKIRMLYLLDPIGKLLGRALIWKLDEPNNFYMDRIYYTDNYVLKLFNNYAKKKGILTKKYVDENNLVLKVQLNRDYGPPKINPYMDTFKFFVKTGNYLTNRFDFFKGGEYWEYVDHD